MTQYDHRTAARDFVSAHTGGELGNLPTSALLFQAGVSCGRCGYSEEESRNFLAEVLQALSERN